MQAGQATHDPQLSTLARLFDDTGVAYPARSSVVYPALFCGPSLVCWVRMWSKVSPKHRDDGSGIAVAETARIHRTPSWVRSIRE